MPPNSDRGWQEMAVRRPPGPQASRTPSPPGSRPQRLAPTAPLLSTRLRPRPGLQPSGPCGCLSGWRGHISQAQRWQEPRGPRGLGGPQARGSCSGGLGIRIHTGRLQSPSGRGGLCRKDKPGRATGSRSAVTQGSMAKQPPSPASGCSGEAPGQSLSSQALQGHGGYGQTHGRG